MITLLTMLLSLAIAADVSCDIKLDTVQNLKLNGWYQNCNDVPFPITGDVKENQTCNSELLKPIAIPVALDASGNTCYVNPAHDKPLDVFWVGHWIDFDTLQKDRDAVAVYWISFSSRFGLNHSDNALGSYMPKDCSPNGVCSCTSIEPLREGWGEALVEQNDWCRSIEVVGIDNCGTKFLNETLRSASKDERCLLLGDRVAGNVTRNFFCSVNAQLEVSGGACDEQERYKAKSSCTRFGISSFLTAMVSVAVVF